MRWAWPSPLPDISGIEKIESRNVMSTECQGCAEYRELSRRQFLGVSGGAAIAFAAPAWLPRVVYAQDECTSRDVIISIFLRGAADGLTLCVPHTDTNYYAYRPTLAVPTPDSGSPNAAIDLDGDFGFPQPLAVQAPPYTSLLPAFQNGDLLVVHACGSTDPSRSHFDAQRFMEVGKPADSSLFTGWLGRHLYSAAPLLPNALLRAVGIGYGLQRTLQGGPASLPIPDLDVFGLLGNAGTTAARSTAIGDMYALVADPVKAAAQTTQVTIDLLNTINFAGYAPAGGATYPSGSFGYAMKTTAALIKADVGVEAVAIDVSGWDTHNNQGVFTGGTMFTLMDNLSKGLGAFHLDMFSGNGRNVTVVVMSEFGRRPAENGSLGCDHGHGNVMMILGNHIAGGRVLTQWPGLAPGQLFEGRDLDVTTDFRDILAEIVQKRLGNMDLGYVFPDYTPTFRGVTDTCPGDLNVDGPVNQADMDVFAACATGPTILYDTAHLPPECGTPDAEGIIPADFDRDGDVDLNDLGELQTLFSG